MEENKDMEPLAEPDTEAAADSAAEEAQGAADHEEDDLEKKLAEAEKKADEMLDKFQRTLAEFDNFRKRTVKEKASMYDDGVRDTVEKLLPVVDNFERAMASAGDSADGSFYKGVEMIYKQFNELMASLGVEEIPSLGEKFDPNLHSAVAHEESEEFGENEITFVMLKGYRHKDKVIRPSMVKVAN